MAADERAYLGGMPPPGARERRQEGSVRAPDLRGSGAIHAASVHGVAIYVLNPQRGWIVGGPGALGRAVRMGDQGTWIYGAKSADVSAEHHCAASWKAGAA